MATILPLQPGIPFYRLTTAIDEVTYHFDVRWNTRDASWSFDVLADDDAETVIAKGIKITLGTYLGRQHTGHSLFRSGVFVAYDTSGQRLEPTLDDLGSRVQVYRYSVEDLFGSDPDAVFP